MFEIDKIPAEIYDSLSAKGVAKEDILLGAYCDRNREHEPQDVYLLATSKELWVLFGVFAGFCFHFEKEEESEKRNEEAEGYVLLFSSSCSLKKEIRGK